MYEREEFKCGVLLLHDDTVNDQIVHVMQTQVKYGVIVAKLQDSYQTVLHLTVSLY